VHTADRTTARWCEMLWSSNQTVNGPIQKVSTGSVMHGADRRATSPLESLEGADASSERDVPFFS